MLLFFNLIYNIMNIQNYEFILYNINIYSCILWIKNINNNEFYDGYYTSYYLIPSIFPLVIIYCHCKIYTYTNIFKIKVWINHVNKSRFKCYCMMSESICKYSVASGSVGLSVASGPVRAERLMFEPRSEQQLFISAIHLVQLQFPQ